MIGLSVYVSGEEVADGLANDLEECALFLSFLGRRMERGGYGELADWIDNMSADEKALIFALGENITEAARG